MTPTDRLIVALDVPAPKAMAIIDATHSQVHGYKIGPQLLLDRDWIIPCAMIRTYDNHRKLGIFLDLKLAETRDTVQAVAERCDELKIDYLSILLKPESHEALLFPHPKHTKLLALLALTDRMGQRVKFEIPIIKKLFGGVICPPSYVVVLRQEYDGLIFCPGIRMPGQNSDNHVAPFSPGGAIAAGADYIIMGRPITQADDPRAAAQAVLDDIAGT